MRTLAILQLSDIHFPNVRSAAAFAVDRKDVAMPDNLVRAASPNPFQNAMKALLTVRKEHGDQIAGIVLCGDLTNAGSIDTYQECVAYLDKTLQLSDADHWQRDQVHVVPGNHDVARPVTASQDRELLAKFAEIEKVWKNRNLPILAVRECRATIVSQSTRKAALYSLNSCLGCGESRYLPRQIRDQLWTLLAEQIEKLPDKDAFSLVGEDLDTPMFCEQHITDLIEKIGQLDETTFPIVVAHHNLLPQHFVRVALYTEVLNSGLIRARLARCSRPIVYCHGHIHTDAIEAISDQRSTGGMIACIAAPEFTSGFNLIEIHYARAGTPLGCVVSPYRISPQHGGVEKPESVRIPFWSTRDIHVIKEDLTSRVASCLNGSFMLFDDLRVRVARIRESKPHANSLAESVSDLEWLGLVEVHARDETSDHWQIKKNDLS